MIFLMCLLSGSILSQTKLEITLQNNSFENGPERKLKHEPPFSWDSPWTEKKLNTPDLHTPSYIEYKVNLPAQEGERYIGLVSRRDFNNEEISQMLSKPLLPNKEYQIKLIACSSENYLSPGYMEEIDGEIKSFEEDLNYNNPVRILLIGRNSEREEILGRTEEIDYNSWREYTVEFMVNEEYDEIAITLESIEIHPSEKRNGNVLIDYISNIYSYE